jgi:hypothetical protein
MTQKSGAMKRVEKYDLKTGYSRRRRGMNKTGGLFWRSQNGSRHRITVFF